MLPIMLPFSSTEQDAEQNDWLLEEEMGGNIHPHHTAIPPQHCNVIAQSVFKETVSVDSSGIIHYYSSKITWVWQSHLLHKQICISSFCKVFYMLWERVRNNKALFVFCMLPLPLSSCVKSVHIHVQRFRQFAVVNFYG